MMGTVLKGENDYYKNVIILQYYLVIFSDINVK